MHLAYLCLTSSALHWLPAQTSFYPGTIRKNQQLSIFFTTGYMIKFCINFINCTFVHTGLPIFQITQDILKNEKTLPYHALWVQGHSAWELYVCLHGPFQTLLNSAATGGHPAILSKTVQQIAESIYSNKCKSLFTLRQNFHFSNHHQIWHGDSDVQKRCSEGRIR